jgi:hypothetical protein
MQAQAGDPYYSGQPLRAQDREVGRLSPTASHVRLHFTPTYSSWLNQIGLWFARIERDVIARGMFSVKDLARKLMRYIHAYSAVANRFPGTTAMSTALSILKIQCDGSLVRLGAIG